MSSILLLHGALGSKEHFNQLVTELEKTMTVYTLNFEGHGGEFSNRPFSISNFEENILGFITEKKLEGIPVFGYSMGGYVALSLTLNYPNIFGKIITLGTKFNWTEESAAQEVKMLNPEIIEEKVPKFAEKLKALHAPNDWKEVMQKTANMMLNLGKGDAISQDKFKLIKAEVIIFRGENDNMVSKEESMLVANLIPKARYFELENVEHPIERISTEIIYRIISENVN
jgi:esterase/lipase